MSTAWQQCGHASVSNGPRQSKERTALFGGLYASPACPSDKSGINMKGSTQHSNNNSKREQLRYWEENLSQDYFVHHKSHTKWPGTEAGPPRQEAGD